MIERVDFPAGLSLKTVCELVKGTLHLPCESQLPDTVHGCSVHSGMIGEGDLFIAVCGRHHDARSFISAAASRGAAGVICQAPLPTDCPQIPWVEVENAYHAWGILAAYAADLPLHKLLAFGVTGTNGKTTTATLLCEILRQAGRSCGLITTTLYDMGNRRMTGTRTTPMPFDLHMMLREMVNAHVDTAVLEISSHALDQNRLGGCKVDYGIFTNLSGEHLDYHESMESYLEAKTRLFTSHLKAGGLALLNDDDPAAHQIAQHLPRQKIIFWGMSPQADIVCRVLRNDLEQGLSLHIDPVGRMESPLCGMINAANITAAVACAYVAGLPLDAIIETVASFRGVPGRLERLHDDKGRCYFIDYAHTHDALGKVLKTLKEAARGQLWVVFGCGGDRDRTKRPLMGAIAEKFSDQVILTSDNPRSEDPLAIIEEILSGMSDRHAVVVKPDRRTAIEYAVSHAPPNATVLIAGKGHEAYQEIGSRQLPFSDLAVLRDALSCRD